MIPYSKSVFMDADTSGDRREDVTILAEAGRPLIAFDLASAWVTG